MRRGTVTIVEPAGAATVVAAEVSVSASLLVTRRCAEEAINQQQRMVDYKQELFNMNDPMFQIQQELASIEAARQRIAQMKEARRLRAEGLRQTA
jgi:putative ubiquitin-RnfH superfamily antitoxin RatB of RatAB toxin-antitoxin module